MTEALKNKIEELLSHYAKEDGKIVHDTIDELCKRGVAKGCYKDYECLVDLVLLLSSFEEEISKMEAADTATAPSPYKKTK